MSDVKAQIDAALKSGEVILSGAVEPDSLPDEVERFVGLTEVILDSITGISGADAEAVSSLGQLVELHSRVMSFVASYQNSLTQDGDRLRQFRRGVIAYLSHSKE